MSQEVSQPYWDTPAYAGQCRVSNFARAVCILLTCSLTGLAQTRSEVYNGRTVGESRVIIRLRSLSQSTVSNLQQLLDADSVRQIGGPTGPLVFHSRSRAVGNLMAAAASQGEILYAEPDYILHTTGLPNDPSFPAQWGLHNLSVPGADIGATAAWDVSTGSTRNIVAVVDTGLDYTHPDLAQNVWSAPTGFTVNLSSGSVTCPAGSHGYNAILRNCDPMDDAGHGTHVSGAIGAAGNNSLGVTGINWTASMMGLKFLDATGSGLTSDAVDAIEFAIQVKKAFTGSGTPVNVRVLSNSWGGGNSSQTLFDEIDKANASDMLFVAAAGNSGSNNDLTRFYPASYGLQNIVAVAATDIDDRLASFSNYGFATVHLGAPGVNIISDLPHSSYGYLSGTSMAAPQVAGAATLLLAACNLDTAGLKAVLLNNVDAVPSLAGRTITGGRLNVNKAIRSCGVALPPAPLAVTCASSSAQAGQSYSSKLTGVGGVGPYSFSIVAGSLPAGLTLNTATGAIAGAPGAAGISNYTAKAVDALNTAVSASCSIAVTPAAPQSIWTAAAAPRSPLVSSTPVNVGVKFRSDVSGAIAAIRFYKGSGNSGTHVGSLYTATGVLLAQASFTAETASGWQQANFAAPVAVAANTTYVASLFTTSGYAIDYDYFARHGEDNAPLHALQSGVDGTNGVYTYAADPQYPAQTYASPNYWVDVAFSAGDVSAPIAPPLAVACGASSAQVGQSYNSALAGSGGVAPYSYSIVSGSLPAGLTLNTTTGVVAGAPTAAGIASFTALVLDSSHTAANSACSINVAPAVGTGTPQPGASIWSDSITPRRSFVSAGPVNIGVKFRADAAGVIRAIRFYKGSGNSGLHVGSLYSASGVLLAQANFTAETDSGWQQVTFATPVTIAPNATYLAAVFSPAGYAVDYDYFSANSVDSGLLHALRSGIDGANGVYVYASSPQFPSQSYADSNYWVDLVFAPLF